MRYTICVMNTTSLPRSFWPLVWSINAEKIDVQMDRRYIIHQLLQFGDLDAFEWLKEMYTLPTLQKIFKEMPNKIYTKKSLHFIINFLLKLEETDIQKEKYLNEIGS